MASDYTKNCIRKLWLYRCIDLLILFSPVAIYTVIALSDGGVTTVGKISVVGCVAVALILSLINVIAQKRLRCPIWIVLIGLYIAIKNYLLPLIVILAIVTVIDDLLLTPIIHYYHEKVVASKVYDDRQSEEEPKEVKQEKK